MEYNDNEVYNHIGVGFLIVFSYSNYIAFFYPYDYLMNWETIPHLLFALQYYVFRLSIFS